MEVFAAAALAVPLLLADEPCATLVPDAPVVDCFDASAVAAASELPDDSSANDSLL